MKSIPIIALLLLAGLGSLHAQYYELTRLQDPEEAALYRKNHVHLVRCYDRQGVKQQISYVAGVDTNGYIIVKSESGDKNYYEYDDHNRLINHLDSVNVRGKWRAISYVFVYYNNGLLNGLTIPRGSGVLDYDIAKKQLNEKFMPAHGKEVRENVYKFDEKLHILFEQYHDSIGRPYRDHSYTYNALGKVESEKINEYYKNNTKNFTAITFTYDEKGRLSSRLINKVSNYGLADDETGIKHNPRYTSSNETYSYNEKGQMIKLVHSDPKNPNSTYIIKKEYYPNGLLGIEQYSDRQERVTNTTMYTYEYYQDGK